MRPESPGRDGDPPVDENPRTVPEPTVRIVLRCPRCDHVWHAASVLPGVWWGVGVTPEKIAGICHCPKCHRAPPMRIGPAPRPRRSRRSRR